MFRIFAENFNEMLEKRKIKTIVLLLCALLVLTVGCTGNGGVQQGSEAAKATWQRYNETFAAKDLKRTLALIDSMEQAEFIDAAKADHLRGMAYDQGWQMRLAEHFYREAYEKLGSDPSQNWDIYTDAGYRCAYLRLQRGDTEGALKVATDILAQVEDIGGLPEDKRAVIQLLKGECMSRIHQDEEAKQAFVQAYSTLVHAVGGEKKGNFNVIIYGMNIFYCCYGEGDYDGAQEWLQRLEEEYAAFTQHGSQALVKEYRGHLALAKALLLQATGHTAEAAALYDAIPDDCIFEPHGYTEAAEYLMAAGRYDEAAYWYEQLDSTYLATDGARMNFDNIAGRLSPRYAAYRKAGRNNEALVIADSICSSIDSALVWQKKNDAAELAVIYQTHERDLQLSTLNFQLYLHRLMAVALVVILLLVGYLLWRTYKYNKELRAKNQRLVTEIEQREGEEQQAIQQLKAQPEESLTTQQQLFRRICDLMDSPERIYTDTGFDRSRLAQLVGTNEHYVSDAINACTNGKSVTAFVNEYRLRYAAHLLATTTDSVSLIAELSGFARSSFFRIFSDAYGMSPSEYRGVAGK